MQVSHLGSRISSSLSGISIHEITKSWFEGLLAAFRLTFLFKVRRARVKQLSHFVGGDLLEVNVSRDELRLARQASSDGIFVPILVEVGELFLSLQSFIILRCLLVN